MRLYGLIGYPLSHSFSEEYFLNKFRREKIANCNYKLFPLDSLKHLTELIIGQKELIGFNVTIPYKEEIIKYLHDIDDTAADVGAVNTIKITRDKESFFLKGYNTDIIGFEETLKPLLKPYHNKALILGTGGASKAVAYVLSKLGIEYLYVSRNKTSGKHSGYSSIDKNVISSHLLVINTTPLGMYPDVENYPDIAYNAITEKHILYDLIYNPAETLFLKKAKEKNAIIFNGLPMLYLQAEESWKIWNQ